MSDMNCQHGRQRTICGECWGPTPLSPTDPLAADDAIVAEAGKRADAATPGPWAQDDDAFVFSVPLSEGEWSAGGKRTINPDTLICEITSETLQSEQTGRNMDLIAAARTDIPALVAIADKRGRALREAEKCLSKDCGDDSCLCCLGSRAFLARIREILGGQE